MTKYITRLWAVDQPNGRILVTKVCPPDAEIARPHNFIGPAPVEPPPQPLSREEFELWVWGLVNEAGGYRMMFTATQRTDLPSVEELPDDSAPSGARVSVTVACERRDGQSSTLLVEVENVGSVDIPQMSVAWVHQNETPQAVQVGKTVAHALGGSVTLLTESGFDGLLRQGESRKFLLDPRMVEAVKSQVVSLSPERFRLAVKSGGQEIKCIDGDVVAAELDALDDR